MKLDIRDILQEPGTTKAFHLRDEIDIPKDSEVEIVGPVDVRGIATGLGDAVHVEANAKGTMRLFCSRCLLPFENEFNVNVEGKYVKDSTSEPEDNEEEVFVLSDKDVILDEMLSHEIILSMPMKPLCKEDCKGICASCGANLNDDSCECHESSSATTAFGRKLLEAMGERSKINGGPEEA